MNWKRSFEVGVTLFKAGKYSEALEEFNQAVAIGGENHFIVYDTRAAAHEALKNPKAALQDAKMTIKLAPQRWHGYTRAARLFQKTHKFEASLKMIELALSYVKPEDTKRREELLKLKVEVTEHQEAIAARERRMRNHMLKLPVEIYNEIFQYVMDEDYAQIITLLHVCGHWRRVVWGSPGLWYTLVLSKLRADRKADLWLERSHGRIRELHVLSDYNSRDLPGRPSFLDKLDWSYLRVCRILSPNILRFFEPSTMFRELNSLEFDANHVDGPYSDFNNYSSTGMKSLSLHRTCFQLGQLSIHFPSLSSLCLENCSVLAPENNILEFFRANPQIESFCFNATQIQGWPQIIFSPSDIENPPTLEGLTDLEIVTEPWPSTILLLDLPSLRTMRLQSLASQQVSDHLHHWASRSPKFLTELSFDRVATSSSRIIEAVYACPTLEVLVLNALFGMSDTIINVLSGQPHIVPLPSEQSRLPCICPRLRHLDVSDCPDVLTSSIHALVKQRLALSASIEGDENAVDEESTQQKVQVNRLEVLKMDGCPMIDIKWIPWFREHVPYVSCVFASASKKQQKNIARRL
ncbi:hypothetical protein D9756_004910 [Leucocoprinus leucothites]|uniref:F-box domain-containing protein n=1 Tax=Leucocoprinus leucothites TaxID=201217 RepID=A0A8H5LKF5_9AGAR|nr:hypothetical protein D9756_004910 [Leucoagaricus leucothites]